MNFRHAVRLMLSMSASFLREEDEKIVRNSVEDVVERAVLQQQQPAGLGRRQGAQRVELVVQPPGLDPFPPGVVHHPAHQLPVLLQQPVVLRDLLRLENLASVERFSHILWQMPNLGRHTVRHGPELLLPRRLNERTLAPAPERLRLVAFPVDHPHHLCLHQILHRRYFTRLRRSACAT